MNVDQMMYPSLPDAAPFKPNFTGSFISPGWNKAQAAIALKVPMSGIPELDAMIRESRRLDAAEKILQAIVTGNHRTGKAPQLTALDVADALLAASGKEKP